MVIALVSAFKHINKRYACFEIIVLLGQQVGIFSKNRHYSSYLPGDMGNDNIELAEGVNYSKTVEVKSDIAEKKMLSW